MAPPEVENCLRNIARIVKPGGYPFVSGIDLDVRARVARDLRWRPVPELIKETHEGDPSVPGGLALRMAGTGASRHQREIGRCGMQPFPD